MGILDCSWSFVREAGKRKGLADFKDMLSVDFVPQHRVPSGVGRGSIGRGKWLKQDVSFRNTVIRQGDSAPLGECQSQSALCLRDWSVAGDKVRGSGGYFPNPDP